MESVLCLLLPLSMGPSLKCGQYICCHSIEENHFLARGRTLYPFPFLCAKILSDLISCRSCVCDVSVSEFILEASFYIFPAAHKLLLDMIHLDVGHHHLVEVLWSGFLLWSPCSCFPYCNSLEGKLWTHSLLWFVGLNEMLDPLAQNPMLRKRSLTLVISVASTHALIPFYK